VLSVFGNELGAAGDAALDDRRVLHVMPVVLGERRMLVVLTEEVESRRLAPQLVRLTYRQASDQLRGMLGGVTLPAAHGATPQLVGHTVAAALATVHP
jgi:hypothetical protein